jgi:hypothetical protein
VQVSYFDMDDIDQLMDGFTEGQHGTMAPTSKKKSKKSKNGKKGSKGTDSSGEYNFQGYYTLQCHILINQYVDFYYDFNSLTVTILNMMSIIFIQHRYESEGTTSACVEGIAKGHVKFCHYR